MRKRILNIAARMALLIGTGFYATSCGDNCDGNEVCGAFECVCVITPCQVNEDCPQGLVCDEGVCAD
ncbi:MAG TPA: hypothetical protein VFW62_13330 [bacterium]|nr:hypothetical protein [bacterium]